VSLDIGLVVVKLAARPLRAGSLTARPFCPWPVPLDLWLLVRASLLVRHVVAPFGSALVARF
jgi:hypothetical protein